MNIVKIARPAEPVLQDGGAFHPESLDVHPVVQITEDPEAPGQNNPEKQDLIPQADSEEPEETPKGDQQDSCGDDPFETDIPNGNLTGGRIEVLRAGPLLLQGAVEQQMMLHVVHAQKTDPAAVQQAM